MKARTTPLPHDGQLPGNRPRLRLRNEGAMNATSKEPLAERLVRVAERALEEVGVVVLPGVALGDGGQGFFRIALTVDEDRMRVAAARLGSLLTVG